MKEIKIKISKETRQVFLPKDFFAVNGENLQSKLIFEFIDEFVDGQARIEYEPTFGDKLYQVLTKEDDSYTIPLKNTLTNASRIDLQLVITEGTNENETPIFKSKIFFFNIDESINAEIEQPDEYPTWIELANSKLNQMDNFDISQERVSDGIEVSITNRLGETTTEKVFDGEKGDSGITFFTIENGHLIAESESASNYENYSISNGHLYLELGE